MLKNYTLAVCSEIGSQPSEKLKTRIKTYSLGVALCPRHYRQKTVVTMKEAHTKRQAQML